MAAMEKIFQAQLDHGSEVLATRMTAAQAAELAAKFPQARYNAVGRTFRTSPRGAKEGGQGKIRTRRVRDTRSALGVCGILRAGS